MHQTLAPRAWIGQRVFPRQAQCADDSFFLEKIEGRYPLNPLTWIEHVYVPFQPTLEPFEPDTQVNGVDWKRVELAIDTWRHAADFCVVAAEPHDLLPHLLRNWRDASRAIGLPWPNPA